MSVRSLDALIVGGGPAALITAALLGKRGLRGLVVDQLELDAMDPADPADWAFDDRHAPLLARVHDTLGLQDVMRGRAVPLRPGLRLIAPGARGELEPEDDPAVTLARILGQTPKTLRKELRILEASAVRVSKFLEGLSVFPASGFFERRKLLAALAEHPEIGARVDAEVSDPLLELLGHLLPFLTHVDVDVGAGGHSLGRLGRPAELILHGPRLPDGGRPLRDVLIERSRRAGFEVHRGAVRGLEPDGRRWRAQVTDRRDAAVVSVVIDASRDLSGIEALPHAIRGRKLAGTLEAARPSSFVIRGVWELDRDALPEPLGRAALVLPEAGERPMWLTLAPSGRDDRVRISVDLPVLSVEHRAGVPPLLDRVRARLAALFPFFETGGVEALGSVETPLFAPDLDPLTALGGVPVRTPVRSVLVAGPVVLPGCARLEGAYLAARQAADAAAEVLGSKR